LRNIHEHLRILMSKVTNTQSMYSTTLCPKKRPPFIIQITLSKVDIFQVWWVRGNSLIFSEIT